MINYINYIFLKFSNQDSESNSVKRPRQSGPSDRGINDVKPQSSGNSLTQVGNDSKGK